MADLIVACTREDHSPFATERLRGAALRLAPPELRERESLLLETDRLAAAVAGPAAEGVWLHEGGRAPIPELGGVCLGGLFGTVGTWWRIGSEAPEGTYALARWDSGAVELVSDICASRTLWYCLTDDLFLASTSQRALVTLLGSFELLPAAIACFMTTGSPGAETSWDARLRPVPPNATITLDRAVWRVTERRTPYVVSRAAGDTAAHVDRLKEAIDATCGQLNLDIDRWVLTSSGGLDSRALLSFLVRNGLRPCCVTWTTRASLRNPLSDACIARRITQRYGVEHEVLVLDDDEIDADTVLSRFVAANEGRNDEIAGYLDGLAMWRDLAAAGVRGIIRGDESMGGRWRPRTRDSVRFANAGATPSDYPEDHLLNRLKLADYTWPEHLAAGSEELLGDYGVRLEQQACIPIFMAGLNGPKGRYVEIVNPLLSRRIIASVRSLPPQLRDRAQAYTRIVAGLDRSIPFARFASTRSPSDFLASSEFLELAVRELTGQTMQRILPGDAPLHILAALATHTAGFVGPRERMRDLFKDASVALPYRLADRLRPGWKGPEPLSAVDLAFRAVLASRMVSLFEEDARALVKDGKLFDNRA
jgi:hypothetical protein